MKKALAISFCALAIVLLVVVVQKSGIIRNPGSQLAQVAYNPVPQTNPINPVAYFRFEGTPSNISTVGSKYLGISGGNTSSPSFQVSSGGQVGKYATLSSSTNLMYITGGTGITNAFAVEMMIKPGQGWSNTELFGTNDNSIDIRWMSDPLVGTFTDSNYLRFSTKTASGTDNFDINMNGANQRSNSYYTDGNWHHLVFKRNIDGTKEIWIDGTLPQGFSKTAPSGSLVSTSSTTDSYFNSSTSYRKWYGNVDEVAIYNTEVPGNLIAQHNADRLAGVAYQNWTPINSVIQGGTTVGALDPQDFAPGSSLDESIPYTTGITTKPYAQLRSYPLPRYATGTTLLPNIVWASLRYQGQVVPDGNSINTTVAQNMHDIALELAQNWHYALTIGKMDPGNNFTSTTSEAGIVASLANQYTNLPFAVISFRAQLDATHYNASSTKNDAPFLTSQILSANHYLQDASGATLVPYSGASATTKYWRPTSTTIADYNGDGDYLFPAFQALINAIPARVAAHPTQAIDLISENGEVVHRYSDTSLSSDPVVVAEATAAGMDNQTYAAKVFKDMERNSYANRIKNLPSLANTKYELYGVDGGPLGRFEWSQYRLVQDAINGQRYSTPDVYPRWASNWKNYSGPWHGFGWVDESLQKTRATGDKFFSPYVAAGWNPNTTGNMTPGQWLGLLKPLAVTGAEFFYTGYFNDTGDYKYSGGGNIVGLPETYTWQNATPSYVQALVSRVENLYKNSDLMTGDTYVYAPNTSMGYGFKFKTSDPNVIVAARKSNSGNVYLIAGNINQDTNYTGNIPNERKVTISLDGQNISFNVRRQGSMYVYDKTNASAPVFYQLDTWHEAGHPSYWSKNFLVDAEISDSGTASISTTGQSGTDFSNADSYITSSSTMGYKFTPRTGSGSTFSLWARARSSSGSAATMSVSIDGGAPQSLAFQSGTFQWVKMTGTFAGLALNTEHTANFSIPGIQFDKFILTPDATFVPAGYTQASDTTPPTAPSNLTSPAKTDQSVDLSWTASTDDTAVVAYDIYKNSVLAGSSISTSYTASGLTPSTAYNFSVKARDAAGNVSNASVTLAVTTNAQLDTTPPSTPSALVSSNLTSTSVQIDWTASTDNVGVTGYEVSKNGAVIAASVGTTSYAVTGLTPQTAYSFTVRAKDAAGNWSVPSSTLSVTTPAVPDTTAPTGSISTPVAGAVLANTATITVAASDNNALDHIDFYRGGTTLIGSAIASGASGNFSLGWNTTTVADGAYSLTAKIYDAAGNSSTTSAVSVTVTNVVTPPADTTPPTVSVSYPATGSTVSGVIAIGANASDNVGVTKVMFYRSGNALIGTDTTASPWEVSFDTATLNNGNYLITAKAYDAANNVTTSATVTITVNNVVADTTKPTASFTSPADGATVTGSNVVLTANATDNVGIDTVKFYQSNGTLLGTGTAVGSNNYSFTWDTTSLANGSQTLYVIAYDTSGNFQQTSNKTVTVNNVDTVNPSNVTGLTSSNITQTSVTLSWNPATDNVALKGYDVYTGTNSASTRFVTGAPGTSYTVTGLTANTSYTLKVVARDTSDNTSLSEASVTIKTLKTDAVAPVATWVSPSASNSSSGSKFTMGSVVTLTATATDDVAMKKVEFRLANGNGTGTVLCTVTAAPYTCNWTVPQTILPTGYNVRAVAWDTSMNSGTTQWVYLKSKY